MPCIAYLGAARICQTLLVLLFGLAITASDTLATSQSPRAFVSAFDCKHIKARNYVFDLSPIAFPVTIESIEQTPPTTTRTVVSVNLCDALPDDGSPADEQCSVGTQVCLKILNEKRGEAARVTQVIAAAGGDDEARGSQADLGEHLMGAERALELEIYGALYADWRQKTKIDLRCSPTAAKDSTPHVKKYDGAEGELKLEWDTPYACAKTMGSPGEDHGDGDSTSPGTSKPADKSWGFLSWFVLLLFAGGIAYALAGLWRNYQEFGVVELPNREFWREAPYMPRTWASTSIRPSRGKDCHAAHTNRSEA